MGISERDEEAAATSTPKDDSGDGPVTIADRVEPGGEGSPGSNQSKTEPMSPTGTHAEPLAVPDLSDMNVGAGDPQAPRHPAVAGSDTSHTGRAPGSEQPLQATSGTAHRAPGLQGSTPDGESVTTDVQAGAARMGPAEVGSTVGESSGEGDDASVPVPGDTPSPGTSEEHREVSGIKLPEADEA